MAKILMIQGTMSNAGKSLLTAGLLRIMKEDGYLAAPFKSQNMALNSFITEEGLEMGRAQVVQAEAAGVKPEADMNPILLKPTTDTGSLVIVGGVHVGNMKAREYFAYKKTLIPRILESFHRLEQRYDVIVIEGAGSPAEINLKQDDIVNMGLAELVDAPVLLVGDIDRGGVFAQLYGTVMLLSEKERARVKGLIINKFRGDKTILDPGVAMIEKLCGIPVVGVVPYMDVELEDEDSLGVHLAGSSHKGLVHIAVIHLPRISNFTDFQVFLSMPEVHLKYVSRVEELGNPDLMILPGTKSTMDDLLWLRESGLEAAVLKRVQAGTPVFGICGGFQMMGMTLHDPKGVESLRTNLRGMEILPVDTEYEDEKTRTRVRGDVGQVTGALSCLSGMAVEGYEIHMGSTRRRKEGQVFSYVSPSGAGGDGMGSKDGTKEDGAWQDSCYGTYIHGFFDGKGIAEAVVRALLDKKGLTMEQVSHVDYGAYKEQQYNRLAGMLRDYVDMEMVYRIIG